MLKSILRAYLGLHQWIHAKVMHSLAIRAYGVHPKNIFQYRAEFFTENVAKEDVVIDIACGTGAILKKISPRIKTGIGIDINPGRLDTSKFSNLRFYSEDILKTDYSKIRAENNYTTAIFSHILEHIENAPELLKAVRAPRVLICVPSQENWYKQTLKDLGLNYLSDPTHFREYTRAQLREHLEDADYHVEHLGFNAEGEIIAIGKLTSGAS